MLLKSVPQIRSIVDTVIRKGNRRQEALQSQSRLGQVRIAVADAARITTFRPDCVQVVIALVVTLEGLPLACEVPAGNTADAGKT